MEEYDILAIMKILGAMSTGRMGSITFWQTCLRFLHDFLIEPRLLRQISTDKQNKFLIYTYQAYSTRSMQEHIYELLQKLTLIALSNNRWTIQELY